MAKRISKEETVMDFFQEASFDKAETIFNLVKSVMKKRAAKEGKPSTKERTGGKKKGASGDPPPPESGIRGDANRQPALMNHSTN